jgi:hypothetical protein
MQKLFLAILLGTSLLTNSCKNELDVMDDYREIMISYGLFNPSDTIHYLRINKGFLGAGNALEMASNPDSTTYQPGTLEVKVEQWRNGVLVHTINLVPDNTVPRDSGLFAFPDQILYRGNFSLAQDGSIYKMISKNVVSGLSATASMKVVQPFQLTIPTTTNAVDFTDTLPLRIRFQAPINGRRFLPIIRFHYTEKFVFDSTQVTEKYFDWSLSELDVLSSVGNEQLEWQVNRADLFRVMAQRIPINSNVFRVTDGFEIIVVTANDDLSLYIDVLKAINSAQTDLQPYTNIQGGIGLFACRYTKHFAGYRVHANTVTEIRLGASTSTLGFVR